MIAMVALAIAAAAIDPCAPIDPPGKIDPAAAAAYVAVARQEEARGEQGTAAAAWREALLHAPGDTTAREALAQLCLKATAGQRFEEGVRLMNAGDKRLAATRFAEVRAVGPDPSAALLEGICRYELGEDESARSLLLEAQSDPRHASAANLFLGLLALREGRADAATWFERASADAGLGASAASLLQLARRNGRLVLSALLGSGGDSNASLAPDGSPVPGGDADLASSAAASLLFRPEGESGFYARASGTYRKLVRFTGFDLGLAQAAAGWQLGVEPRHLRGEYSYDFVGLGGAPYLSAHRLLAEGRVPLGPVSLAASYSARFESFLTDAASGYSGVRHAFEVSAERRWPGGSLAGIGWQGVRDLTSDPSLAYLEQGPRVEARLALSGSARLGVDASFLWRGYDGTDPSLGVSRADHYLDVALLGELEFAERWTLRLSLSGRSAFSNVDAFVYTQMAGGLSVAWAMGLL